MVVGAACSDDPLDGAASQLSGRSLVDPTLFQSEVVIAGAQGTLLRSVLPTCPTCGTCRSCPAIAGAGSRWEIAGRAPFEKLVTVVEITRGTFDGTSVPEAARAAFSASLLEYEDFDDDGNVYLVADSNVFMTNSGTAQKRAFMAAILANPKIHLTLPKMIASEVFPPDTVNHPNVTVVRNPDMPNNFEPDGAFGEADATDHEHVAMAQLPPGRDEGMGVDCQQTQNRRARSPDPDVERGAGATGVNDWPSTT